MPLTAVTNMQILDTVSHGSQGLGLEPNKDLIRTCKDQY